MKPSKADVLLVVGTPIKWVAVTPLGMEAMGAKHGTTTMKSLCSLSNKKLVFGLATLH